jgi:twitching motility protein PilT
MAVPTREEILFGRLAIKHNLVTQEQVKECLALRQKNGNNSLGKILVAKGYISAGHYQQILQHVQQGQGQQGQGQQGQGQTVGGGAANGGGTGTATATGGSSAGARAKAIAGITTVDDAATADFRFLAGKPLDEYLQLAREIGASDLHFQVDAPPFLRFHGRVVFLRHPVMTPEYTEPRIREILGDYEKEVLERRLDVDFCYEAPHGRYRANVMRQRKGLDAVFRVIPERVPTLEELHLPQSLSRFTKYRQGIVLITGPAGCGKSSTMAALVDIINRESRDHIVTVEDPIEYIIESKNCNVNQRHVRVHTESFASALKSAMRADPDYICVGEMRDLETISMAITAAETGHLVLGTLHTTNATRSVDRIIDVFSPSEQDQIRAMVSESLRGVISQQLIPRADGRGREPALEVLFTTPAIGNLIRERKTFQLVSLLQTGAKQGMVMMDDSIAELLRRRVITREEARFRAEHPARFK